MDDSKQPQRPTGMRAFWVIWVGQVLSMLGTGMTNFGLQIWLFSETGRATELALMGAFFMVPLIATSPFAGVWVDRSNRKLMMMLSDLGAGVVTIALLVLYSTGVLQVWHLYLGAAVTGVFQAFQWPAYSAAISVMLPKEQYVRANSLLEIVFPGSNILAPLLAGSILGLAAASGVDGLRIIFAFDVVSFIAAIGTLLFVFIPNPERTEEGKQGEGNMLREAWYGFQYILERPGLFWLQTIFLAGNFLFSMALAVQPALILARSGSSEVLLGTIQTAGAIGGVVGGLIVGAWGGFKRRVDGVLLGWAGAFLFGGLMFSLGRPDTPFFIGLWMLGQLVGSGMAALINASNQAIWQSKVAPDVQGRVFSARRIIALIAIPVAGVVAGPLVDFVLEPAMQPGGALVPVFGGIVGTGDGAGMSVMFLVVSVIGLVVVLSGYLVPVIRDVERILPDHDQDAGPSGQPEEVSDPAPSAA